ncbi:hypothetical protein J2847_002012 [Azospirillum agricola]|uniref:hypothetical protein n=1 Tax=Azospirillum agricola TaxID=1720247 RepID=UPI001AE12E33|nr:hypothetical protein [Azospirillum agricola]MBP2228721.1 hypothetical protein [Azospirillum agricola]
MTTRGAGAGPACLAIPRATAWERAYRRRTMLDILVLALTAGFFAGSIAYVHACDRL